MAYHNFMHAPLNAWIGRAGGWLERGTVALGVGLAVTYPIITHATSQAWQRMNFMVDEFFNRPHVDEIMDECDDWLWEDEANAGPEPESKAVPEFGYVMAERSFGLEADVASAGNTWLVWLRRNHLVRGLQRVRDRFNQMANWLRVSIAFLLFYEIGPFAVLSFFEDVRWQALSGALWALSHTVIPQDKHLRPAPFFYLTRTRWDVGNVGSFGETPGAVLHVNELLPPEIMADLRVVTLSPKVITQALAETVDDMRAVVPTTTRRPTSWSLGAQAARYMTGYADERGIDTGWFNSGLLRDAADFRLAMDMHDVLSRIVWRLQRKLALMALTGGGIRNIVLRVPTALANKGDARCWHDAGSFFPWVNPELPAIMWDEVKQEPYERSRVAYPSYRYWLPPALRHKLRLVPDMEFPPLRPPFAQFLAHFLERGHVADRTLARDLVASDIEGFLAKDLRHRRAWWPSAALGLYVTGGSWNATERDLVHAFAILYGFAVVWGDAEADEIRKCELRLGDRNDHTIFDVPRCEWTRRERAPASALTWAWHALKTFFSRGAEEPLPSGKELTVTVKFPI
jgi:hypothetical protein